MARAKKILAPTYTELIVPTYKALLALGGSGTNNEICDQVIKDLKLSDEAVEESHLGSDNQTELEYQLAWARTYLKNYGVIINTRRSVWAVTREYLAGVDLDPKIVVAYTAKGNAKRRESDNSIPIIEISDTDAELTNDEEGYPDEIPPWKQRLMEVLLQMDPYGFERLTQRLLRECGFDPVVVTKRSRDGGIDGRGKLKINETIGFNVAFQCKRYKGAVDASAIRDFRGSLANGIEKGIFITTGTYTKAAKDEASDISKTPIELIDGEEFVDLIIQYQIGVNKVVTYEIDENYFNSI